MSAAPQMQQSASQRSRTNARKRANDENPYQTPKHDHDQRVKRIKRDDGLPYPPPQASASNSTRQSSIDFVSLPTAALHRYLVLHDLVPYVHPNPLSPRDPHAPAALLSTRTRRSTTPDNGRRRSARNTEDDALWARAPILADAQDVHEMLAQICARHANENAVREVDTIAAFSAAVHFHRRL
ncbi:unnamed protein product [Peniophora sp. CBMAI 1063]|nr:unnamed protein product [Peniophora sp. CBMAI 1063]